MSIEMTPELVVWATYGAGFLFTLGWALACARHAQDLKAFKLEVRLVGCVLLATCWPGLLLDEWDWSEDEEEDQDGPVS